LFVESNTSAPNDDPGPLLSATSDNSIRVGEQKPSANGCLEIVVWVCDLLQTSVRSLLDMITDIYQLVSGTRDLLCGDRINAEVTASSRESDLLGLLKELESDNDVRLLITISTSR
jgi:hypothetical protein